VIKCLAAGGLNWVAVQIISATWSRHVYPATGARVEHIAEHSGGSRNKSLVGGLCQLTDSLSLINKWRNWENLVK